MAEKVGIEDLSDIELLEAFDNGHRDEEIRLEMFDRGLLRSPDAEDTDA